MSDPKVKVAERRAAVLKAYKNVFNNPDGAKVLSDLMNAHGMMSTTFSGNVNEMILKEGERNVVLRILAILKVDEAALKERIDRYVRDQQQ